MSTEQSPTVVPSGISDPVELARVELKAALAAIEEKSNIPKRIGRATDKAVRNARRLADRRPVVALAGIITLASATGCAVWGVARLLSR
ncbi:hypothetical protein [Microbacterium sp. gxy059]|uniref:hypothetical protein n=1 Tax=Microbacterium sp. gxy059 TaxID=2957199 RepID=UPI003D969D22